MTSLNVITLLFNGITLALALGFLIIVLWQDARKELNQFFAIFLFLVTLWNMGSLIALGVLLIDDTSVLLALASSIMEIGFTGSSIAIYTLTAVLVGVHTRRFRWLAFASLVLVLGYQVFLILNQAPVPLQLREEGVVQYRFQNLSALFYLTFDGLTFYLIWRYQRKIRPVGLFLGLNLFVIGQSLGFLNPALGITAASINISSLAALVISFAVLKREIISPLAERITQLEAIHKVSLAITSQISLERVLEQIAIQAAGWLDADAAGIFLVDEGCLRLATVHNLPASFIHSTLDWGCGVAGTVAQTRQSIYLENYGRDWKGAADLPLARETFGSVISVPLMYGNDAIGVLMVISGRQGHMFRREDVRPLELLGAQAAVAIAHSHSFAEQNKLTAQVEAARSQLETVLTSTENPVIAINRQFRLIFANPAAQNLFIRRLDDESPSITRLLPANMLPEDYREVLKQLKRSGSYIYEVSLRGQVFLCHVGQLGRPRPAGWVAVLNDVTQLKELDRLKSEMVRMTSHDLKNPLQAAMANLELLEEDVAAFDNVEVHTSVATIGKQLLRMNRIIAGILDLERLKAGTLAMVACHPRQIIDNSLDEVVHIATDKRITLQAMVSEDVPCFLADPGQFERALINLLENAVKFTPEGGQVTVRVRHEADSVVFEVEDNGIGIPANLQPVVFDRFVRGGQRGQKGAEHISGSGLGLSIVKTIVENHNGEVWLCSTEGLGTTFYIRVPAAMG
ncbi:MAG: GAF domain-containing sensor histidine kinase [Chloroflexi bacterium]|nr:GAF domain-containing sensor histidine kinase [Chloroflexota bacterium]